MKHVVLLLLCWGLGSAAGHAQAPAPDLPLDPRTHRIAFTGVVPVPGATAAQLYARAVEWIAHDGNPQLFAAQRYDPAQGVITVRQVAPLYNTAAPPFPYAHVQYVLTLYLKPGRYKYVLTHLEYLTTAAPYAQQPLEPAVISGMFDKQWRSTKADAARQLQAVLPRLQASMATTGPDADDY